MQPAPLIGLGTVRHARARPAVHRFSYRSFFLRLPLRTLAGSALPLRMLGRNRRAPFAVDDRDHGDGSDCLTWIDGVLRHAGVLDAAGEVWLHTMPRVLGYVFNPVSFWFCHRADGALRAVLCEVNNTFGERHCYLLAHADGRPIAWGEDLQAAKAFYVSPFCAVQGRYRFRFLLARERFVARIDYFDGAVDGVPLLATSIEGRLQPATDTVLLRAFFGYPLLTVGVIARIHWHALRLWLKRVPLISRPAAPALGAPSLPDPR